VSLSRREFFQGIAAVLEPPKFHLDDAPASADADLHLLNRISYGILPGDVTHIRDIGYRAYLVEQLNPDAFENKPLESRLWRMPILAMDREAVFSLSNYEYRAHESLVKGAVTRAVYSEAQLYERMVEFWSDHFNIPADGEFAPELVGFQRDVIRPNALGTFRNLLMATAKSPAMLYYLDNFVNIAEAPNENYARELLELHTLGVDADFSEADVKAVARAFTGWTVHPKTRTGFYFDGANHDGEAKRLLGHELPAGRGIEDGLHVLSLLSNHVQTARFVCQKLCRRFVSDSPPAELIESLTQVWISTDGAIKPVLLALFQSKEFQSSAGQKLRRPFDFVVGALRATGTEIHNWWILDEILQDSGQYPYGWHPPNGYPDVAAAWINTSGLLARWNMGMRVTHTAASDPENGWGLSSSLYLNTPQATDSAQLVDSVATRIFGGPLTGSSRAAFIQYVQGGLGGDPVITPAVRSQRLASLHGLMLASPLFQWR
jgi:hypothetical protein